MDETSLLIRNIWRALALLLSLGLFACSPIGISDPAEKWLPTQVRMLDPAESQPNPIPRINPYQDLIALYSRETSAELEIRLDLLELELRQNAGLHLDPGFDLYLELDFVAGSPGWDLSIKLPAQGSPTVEPLSSQSFSEIRPRFRLEAQLDYLSIGIPRAALPDLRPGYFLRAYLTAPGSSTIIDQIARTYSESRVDPLPLLLIFWNTLPAHTPAQALRRWDGAHTGPLGERHGLKHLLDASRTYQLPVVLLDLKTPTNLGALEMLEQIPDIIAMERAGLLILPETLPETYFGHLPAWANQRAAQSSRQTAQNFGLPASPFLFAPSPPTELPANYELIFIRQATENNADPMITRKTSTRGQQFIYLPARNEFHSPSEVRVSRETRYNLLAMARHQVPKEFAVFSQDLPHSPLGDPQTAREYFRYFAGHPWMQVLNAADLQTLAACAGCAPLKPVTTPPLDHPSVAGLQTAPPSPISELAWQFFLDLSAPASNASPELASLRETYLGEIGHFLAAAEWEAANAGPTAMRKPITVNCALDSDYDGRPECLLANDAYFALLDPDGGRLALLFARSAQGTTQLVGAGSQFIVGLSDRSEWNLAAGPLADPANIPGALAAPWVAYEITELAEGVRFTAPGVEKEFKLSNAGLQIQVKTEQPQNFQIPLVVAPETRFQPGWAERFMETEIPQGWVWGITQGPQIAISAAGEQTSHNFQESYELLFQPENPNLGYPPGHFLPFPLAVIDLPAQTELGVAISLFAGQPLDQ